MPTVPMFIDTDPGVDDALAILMALDEASVDVVGLGIGAGNVGLAHTTANALKLLEVAGADVPVFPGCGGPLVRPAEDAAFVHGRDGFGDVGYRPAATRARDEHAALALLRLSHEHAGRLLVVAMGPLGNLALALALDPTLPQRVARLVVMGGAVRGLGNTAALAAEFNIGFDPEAAHMVFAGWPGIELVDWESVLDHALGHDEADRWLAAGDHRGRFYDAISRRTRDWSRTRRDPKRWICADALAMAVALEPAMVTRREDRAVWVELEGRHTRGMTVVDWEGRSGAAAATRIVLGVDRDRFAARVRSAVGAS